MTERQHGHNGGFGRGHDLLVQQALPHQQRLDMMASVDRNILLFGRAHGGSTSLSSCDDCSDGLAVECTGQIALLQTINDLNRTTVLCGLHQLKHGSLDDNIVEIHIL